MTIEETAGIKPYGYGRDELKIKTGAHGFHCYGWMEGCC